MIVELFMDYGFLLYKLVCFILVKYSISLFYMSKICRMFVLFLVQDADSLLYLEDEINPKLNKQQKHLLAIIGNLIFVFLCEKYL